MYINQYSKISCDVKFITFRLLLLSKKMFTQFSGQWWCDVWIGISFNIAVRNTVILEARAWIRRVLKSLSWTSLYRIFLFLFHPVVFLQERAWICRVLQKLKQHVVVSGLAPCYPGGASLNASRVAKFEQAQRRIWFSPVLSWRWELECAACCKAYTTHGCIWISPVLYWRWELECTTCCKASRNKVVVQSVVILEVRAWMRHVLQSF